MEKDHKFLNKMTKLRTYIAVYKAKINGNKGQRTLRAATREQATADFKEKHPDLILLTMI